jgi:hypothetical protein
MRPVTGLGLATGLLALVACILPDRDIVIVDENVQNKHPVRFVEPIPITEEALDTCLSLKEVMPSEVCQPSDPERVLPHFLDPTITEYNFCSCGFDTPEEDSRKLRATTLYVEDRRNDLSQPLDPIYAALQLDLQPAETDPAQKVEYISYVNPNVALKPDNDLKYEPPRRPDTGRELRQLNLGNSEEPIDLCNGTGMPLRRGYHTLRVVVSDAPWFSPTGEDDVRELGVPDLANGATYDTLEYVFYCDDKSNPDNPHCNDQCQPKGTE